MQNEHLMIRYWGVIGCTVLSKSARAAADSLKMLLNDRVPAVRVAAAETLVA